MWNVTRADAGFPGRANKGFVTPPVVGMVANVVGFPGLIVTRPKWMVPLKFRSITGFNKSVGPMEVQPVVIRISALSIPFCIAATWASILEQSSASRRT